MIRVNHSACLALGGTFDPCYMLTINAVPSQMGPSTNKRNSSLIQSFMAEILSVPPERGIVTFVSIAEENLAVSGNTILGEMEKLEKQDPSAVKKLTQDAHRKSQTFKQKSIPTMNGDANGMTTTTTTSTSSSEKGLPALPAATATSHLAELPASEETRPRTANGSFAAENGLRMNGISTDQLTGKDAKLPNGRPKTFGAPPSTSSVPQQVRKEPQRSSIQRSSTTESLPQPKSIPIQPKSTPIQPKNITSRPTTINTVPQAPKPTSNIPTSAKPSTQRTKSMPAPPPEPRTKNTYLDNVSSLTSTKDQPASEAAKKKDAANTAKRRSTITATPKLPPPPPSDKEKDDTKSMSSKLSKRKSFFREVFKREKTPAWYK